MTMPDYAAALVAHLRDHPAPAGIVPPARIAMELDDAGNMPQSWVLVRKAGGPGSHGAAPYYRARVDIQCYGATGYEAFRVARAVQAALVPVDRRSTRIHRHGCVIPRVWMESGHLGLETPEGWPFVQTAYALNVYEVEVPV